MTDVLAREDVDTAELLKGGYRSPARKGAPMPAGTRGDGGGPAWLAEVPIAELADLIQELTDQMHGAAGELQFELAARLRDEIAGLKRGL